MALFKKGYDVVREEKVRQEKNAEKMRGRLFQFFVKEDGDEVPIRFLTEEPITFYKHNIQSFKNGKEYYESEICQGENCPYCEDGNNPTFAGAFLIWDRRPFEVEDKKTKKKIKRKGSLKLYVQGTKILSQLDRLSSKYGLTNRDYVVTRLGKGTSTTYTFDREDEEKLTKKEIEEMLSTLPDAQKKIFDGSQESLYKILEKQLEMMAGSEEYDEDDDDIEEDNDTMVSLDDEDEEPVKKSSTKSLFGNKKKRK